MKMVTLKRLEQVVQGGLHLGDDHVELLDCIVLLQNDEKVLLTGSRSMWSYQPSRSLPVASIVTV